MGQNDAVSQNNRNFVTQKCDNKIEMMTYTMKH